ncbi:MAG: hypothetical protein SFW09_07620 [Hyphomicrobiaceae bacterium]|nr:hypothetical protein [Hyphomicrobiaceae bacterium]
MILAQLLHLTLDCIASRKRVSNVRCAALGLLIVLALVGAPSPVAATDDVILHPGRIAVRIGQHSPFALVKSALAARLETCRREAVSGLDDDPPLRLGSGTRRRIAEVAACLPGLKENPLSPEHRGVLTRRLWRTLLPDVPPPTLAERIDALTLSFEATDFSDPPAWNFCQDTPGAPEDRPAAIRAGATCFNATDPCSMLTWGPRGATAGQGAEIQWILWRLHRQAPDLLAEAFGPEAPAVVRFLALKRPSPVSCDGSAPAEHFMCAVWLDPLRKKTWEAALLALGSTRRAREAYSAIYSALEFDGYKIRQYFELWRSAGLRPSEVDYAFFFDRATHIGSPPASDTPQNAAFRDCLAGGGPGGSAAAVIRNAVARRCLSLTHPHQSQPVDRLGRDVAYYRDAFGQAVLSDKEQTTWTHHIPLDAVSGFGLSDARPAPPGAIESRSLAPEDRPPETRDDLTEAERACPLQVRRPDRRRP